MKPFIAIGTIALLSASVSSVSASTVRGSFVRSPISDAVPAGYRATGTKAFPNNVVRDFGVAADTTPMHITVSMTTRNHEMINALLAAQNTRGNAMYHKYLTPTQTKALFSPSDASVRAVASYLQSKGFAKITPTADNEFIVATGNVRSVNAAFDTGEHYGLYAGTKAVLFNSRAAKVPESISAMVKTVAGVHTIPWKGNVLTRSKKARVAGTSCTTVPTNPVVNPVAACVLNDFTPRDYWVTFDESGDFAGSDGSLPGTYHTGINTPIGIFAEGILSGVTADLRQQEATYSLVQTSYQVINETGNPTQTDTSGADEFDLDTQTSTGVASDVKRLDIFDAASLDDSDLIPMFDQFKNMDIDKAGSASFGGCTSLEETSGNLATFDAIYAEAAVQGQTIFASSGDTGYACEGVENGVPAGIPGTEYPASSEYVVGVGGTSLFATPTDLYQGEIAWAGAGGGLEPFETEGPWASSVATTSTGTGVRSVPDISEDADPNISGADVTVAGVSTIIGGTSLASPIALAKWAIIESSHSESLGFAAPLLYKEFGDDYSGPQTARVADLTETVGGFNDVQMGTNVGYPATAGYDLASGMGSLDVALQIQHIND